MAMETQDIIKRSATNPITPAPRARDYKAEVAKLIDVSSCVGCKACQVACSEWNDIRDEVGHCVGVYDNPADLSAKSWTVMRFSETDQNGKLEWLIRKDGCMHCEDPGCLKACPSAGAIIQYANGIVDFQQDNCIGCGYCIAGCPFNIPRLNKEDNRVYKCTLCVDRVSIGQDLSNRGHSLRHQERDAGGGAAARGQTKSARLRQGGHLQPAGGGRYARDVRSASQ